MKKKTTTLSILALILAATTGSHAAYTIQGGVDNDGHELINLAPATSPSNAVNLAQLVATNSLSVQGAEILLKGFSETAANGVYRLSEPGLYLSVMAGYDLQSDSPDNPTGWTLYDQGVFVAGTDSSDILTLTDAGGGVTTYAPDSTEFVLQGEEVDQGWVLDATSNDTTVVTLDKPNLSLSGAVTSGSVVAGTGAFSSSLSVDTAPVLLDKDLFLANQSVIADALKFPQDATRFTSFTTDGINGAIANGVQVDVLNSTLSFSSGNIVMTGNGSETTFIRMFVDATELRGKDVRVIYAGSTTEPTAVGYISYACTTSGGSEYLPYATAVSPASSFDGSYIIHVPLDAVVLYPQFSQTLSEGESITITKFKIVAVDDWEREVCLNTSKLTRTRKWLNDLKLGITNNFNVAVVGDSWTAPTYRISEGMYSLLSSHANVSKAGWCGFRDAYGGGGQSSVNLGTMTLSGGWEYVLGVSQFKPDWVTGSPAIDAGGVSSTNSGDSIEIIFNPYVLDRIYLKYDGTEVGSYRNKLSVSSNGGATWTDYGWTTNTVDGSGTVLDSVSIIGSLTVMKKYTIETISGTNTFYGCYAALTSVPVDGFSLAKCGVSGGLLSQFSNVASSSISAQATAALQEADLDLVVITFATNEETTYPGYTPKDFYDDYAEYIGMLRSALGYDVDILIVTPPQNATDREIKSTMFMWRDAQRYTAMKLGVAYADLIPAFGFWNGDYNYGSPLSLLNSDNLHPNSNGIEVIKQVLGEALGL